MPLTAVATNSQHDSDTWIIGPISKPRLQWAATFNGRRHQCPHCSIALLTGERAGFCCGTAGKYLPHVPPLPQLPKEYEFFIRDPQISSKSRVLNLLFSFASMETSEEFPWMRHNKNIPSFFSIQARVYHRLRPKHRDSCVRWLLFDGFMDSSIPHANWASTVPPLWVTAMKQALLRINPFARSLQQLSSLSEEQCPDANIVLREGSALNEIAAIVNYENTSTAQVKPRQMVVVNRSGSESYIKTLSRLWEPLAYPLLFPHATLGWGLSSTRDDDGVVIDDDAENDVTSSQIWYYRIRLLCDKRFSIFGRLTNEYLVDIFTRSIESRLQYIRSNQDRVRARDAALMGAEVLPDIENVYLPASFIGSRRWASQQIADSLAIAAAYGPPTFWITMTCNPEWPEITSQLRNGQD
ncbi:hypothetical protein K435DRAFT_22473, partial [Dendrothele bispora CBS 962.96]